MSNAEGQECGLPDLPQLENVRANLLTSHGSDVASYSGVVVVAVFAWLLIGLSLALLWGISTYWRFIAEDKESFRLVLVALFLLIPGVLWLAYRALFADYLWHASPEGFTVGSALRKRFTPWTQVLHAELQATGFHSAGVLKIDTPQRQFKLAAQRGSAQLVASIWQHLRRQGWLEDSDLTKYLLAFWDHIPDEIPTDIVWENPKPSAWKGPAATAIFMLLIFVVMLVMGVIYFPWFVVVFIGPMVVADVLLMLNEASRARGTASSLRIRDHSFSAITPQGQVEGRWEDVAEAYLNSFAIGFTLRAGNGRVHVPLQQWNERSEKLALAVVRAVRKAGGPLMNIPDFLKAGDETRDVREVDCAGLSMTISEIAIAPFMPIVLSVYCLVGALTDPTLNKAAALGAAAVLALAAGVIILAVVRFSLTADAEGITKRNLWGSRTVLWRDVANTEFFTQPLRQGHRYRVKLTDARGKALLDEKLSYGSPPNRDRLLSFIRGRLQEQSPDVVQSKTWLARPWTPAGPTGGATA